MPGWPARNRHARPPAQNSRDHSNQAYDHCSLNRTLQAIFRDYRQISSDYMINASLFTKEHIMKKVLGIYSAPLAHWVGDGFPVRSLFGYDGLGKHLSPFLLLDHAAPMQFPPATKPRGVGQHPHRGFETVT